MEKHVNDEGSRRNDAVGNKLSGSRDAAVLTAAEK